MMEEGKKMGDLIMRLPTDNVVMPPEERDNFRMLFPEEAPPSSSDNTAASTTTVARPPEKNTQKLKKEVMSLALFIGVFFLLNLPYVKNLIMEYVPICSRSWIATHLVQAILFAFVLWLVINSEYSRV